MMTLSSRKSRSAFTLVELLVVVAIIGMLVSILLPAVQAARNAGRQTVCKNNLRQIGVALNSYHASNNEFPIGGLEWRPANGDKSLRQLAWSAFLLPYLEQQPLHDQLNLNTAYDSSENAFPAAVVLPVYLCPTSERGEQLVEGRGPINYGGIYGERISDGTNSPPKGVMLYDIAISAAQIKDGLSQTLIVAEDSRSPNGSWIDGRNIFDQAFAINAAPIFENDIRSDHPGGAHGVRADGSVHFMEEGMDLRVLAALCTRDGSDPRIE